MNQPVALITGASVRIGQAIARKLHSEGYDLWLHYRKSEEQAQQLADELGTAREGVTRLLKMLEADRVIEMERGKVRFLKQPDP